MLILYVRTGCPYCAIVLQAAKEMGIELTLKNIADIEIAEELVREGGKRRVPFLIDEERGVRLYESEDIVDYLHTTYTGDGV